MSDHDRALRAAAEALKDSLALSNKTGWADELAKACVAAYLDSLLEGLPEEAVEAGVHGFLHGDIDAHDRGDNVRDAVHAFLRSLRTGLGDAG